MKNRSALKRSAAALMAASLIMGSQVALSGPAAADRYHRHGSSYSYRYGGPYYGYRYGHHGYRYGYPGYRHHGHSGVSVGVHGHGSNGAAVAVALGAGLVLGYLLTRPQTYAAAPPRAQTSAPTFGYGRRVQRDCKPTTGRGLHRGRPAVFGGTFCYDAGGQGYIVPGSEYLIGYAN